MNGSRVDVALETDDHALQITLDDDGPGIADHERDRVLSRGERADEQMPGSGLGLAIVDDLARLYDGRLELADSPLSGLRVVLFLPLAESFRTGKNSCLKLPQRDSLTFPS